MFQLGNRSCAGGTHCATGNSGFRDQQSGLGPHSEVGFPLILTFSLWGEGMERDGQWGPMLLGFSPWWVGSRLTTFIPRAVNDPPSPGGRGSG